MPRVELMFPSKYLTAADLLQAGRDVVVTIERIYADELQTKDGGKKKAWCVKLRAAEKLWVLNKTNALVIADLYGPEADAWVGKRVALYPARVSAFGKMVDAVRVRPERPKEPAKKRNADPEPGDLAAEAAAHDEELAAS